MILHLFLFIIIPSSSQQLFLSFSLSPRPFSPSLCFFLLLSLSHSFSLSLFLSLALTLSFLLNLPLSSSISILSENVLFVSVHGYGPREEGMEHLMPGCAFYPGSGRTALPMIYPPNKRNDREVNKCFSIVILIDILFVMSIFMKKILRC